MTELTVHTIESAPEPSRAILSRTKKSMGFVPNLYGVLAGSPALLEAYTTLGSIFERSSFNATERQVVLLTVAVGNDCEYCVAGHSSIAGMQHVPEQVVEALRTGIALPDAKLEALRVFTAKVVQERGWVSPDDVQAFLDSGYSRAALLDVLLGVGMKTISTYANHVAETPLDEAFQPHAWKAPDAIAAG
jgi:AhpD family alkylhydroperoxidase